MSDEETKPPVPKQKKVIKIGSQRPGYVPDPPKAKEKPLQPPARPAKDAPKRPVAADPQAANPAAESMSAAAPVPGEVPVAAAEVIAAGEPSTAATAPTAPVADVALPETAAQETTVAEEVSSATGVSPVGEVVTASDVNVPPAPDVVAVPNLDDIKLEMSDEELEMEIAAAMGENVESLMAGQVGPSAAEEEVEVEGRYKATVLRIFRESVLFDLPGPYNGARTASSFPRASRAGYGV